VILPGVGYRFTRYRFGANKAAVQMAESGDRGSGKTLWCGRISKVRSKPDRILPASELIDGRY